MDKTIKLACLLAIIIFSSCASRKDFVYLQDMDELQEYPMVQKYEAIIHRDDRLSIIVNSKNPELSLPFNMSGSRSYSVEADGSISNNEVGVLSDEKEKGYLVDINGNIDFPVLGQLHVEGLTRRQLTELIKKRLINEELLKDPMVTVNFLNFKFSVLGEVGHVGPLSERRPHHSSGGSCHGRRPDPPIPSGPYRRHPRIWEQATNPVPRHPQ